MNKFYNQIWKLVLENKVDESNIEEMLIARLCSMPHLEDTDEHQKKLAFDFLRRTSIRSSDIDADSVKYVNIGKYKAPEIKAMRISSDISALVYKIQSDFYDEIYEIAFFNKGDDGRYIFSRKEDLSILFNKYCLSSQNEYPIRQIGDHVLHSEARDATDFSGDAKIEIEAQIKILKDNLIKTGGVGIAANQCGEVAHPLKIILSGVDYESPEHVIKAVTRYQTALFPSLKVLINPVIISQDDDMSEFTEVISPRKNGHLTKQHFASQNILGFGTQVQSEVAFGYNTRRYIQTHDFLQ